MTLVGYRKFSLTAGSILICTGLVIFMDKFKASDFVDVVKWALGLYMGGNVGAKVADKVVPSVVTLYKTYKAKSPKKHKQTESSESGIGPSSANEKSPVPLSD